MSIPSDYFTSNQDMLTSRLTYIKSGYAYLKINLPQIRIYAYLKINLPQVKVHLPQVVVSQCRS